MQISEQRLMHCSKHFCVWAANAEASIGKGHGRFYASTSARSSLLLLQLSQPGYRLPHPLWQPTVRDTKVTLPFCHSKGVTHLRAPCPTCHLTTLQWWGEEKHDPNFQATSRQLEFSKNIMQHISRQINLRNYKKGCIREKKISVPSRMVTLSITV